MIDDESQPNGLAGAQDLRPRAALYVDGFNLYHPIVNLGADYNFLKWACLWRLGELICEKGGQRLVKVVFCTAVPKIERDAGKHERHIRFNSAQAARGVEVLLGHYVPEQVEQGGVPTGETKWTEKQTDINVSLSLLFDGLDDVYDVAFLLSADTDQVATARVFSERLAPKGKQFIGIAPMNRRPPAGYSQYGFLGLTISRYQLECCVMPEQIQGPNKIIVRPVEYAPPADWIHPDERPKDKPPKPPKVWMKGAKG